MKFRQLFTCAVAIGAASLLAIGTTACSPAKNGSPTDQVEKYTGSADTDELLAGMLGDWRVTGWSMGGTGPVNFTGLASRRRVPGSNIVREHLVMIHGDHRSTFETLYTINDMNHRWQLVSHGEGMNFLGTLEGDRIMVADANGGWAPGNKVELKGVGWEGVDMDYAVTMEFHPPARDANGKVIDPHGMGSETHTARIKIGDADWAPHSEYKLVPIHDGVDMNDPSVQEQWGAFATPGETHIELLKSVGEWNVEMRIDAEYAAMDEDLVATGTASIKSVLGGRFVEEVMTTTMPFPGAPNNEMRMILGYHNGIGKFQLSYASNQGTGIDFYEGDYDPELGAVVMQGKQWQPVFGVFTDLRVIVYPEQDNATRTEIHSLIGQHWRKIVTVTYTRKGS